VAGELAALIGVEDLRADVADESFSFTASLQKAASRMMDSRQASTGRLNRLTTAGR